MHEDTLKIQGITVLEQSHLISYLKIKFFLLIV